MIETTPIATNRYAPSGAEAISLYANGEAAGLTLAQLAISVCLRSAAAQEAQSVVKMNKMTAGSEQLEKGSEYLASIAAGTADWTEAKAYLTGALGIESSALPDDLTTYDRRMTAVAALKAKLDALVQTQQREMIDLQTLVNRRDVAYSTSSNVVKAFGTSMEADAANF